MLDPWKSIRVTDMEELKALREREKTYKNKPFLGNPSFRYRSVTWIHLLDKDILKRRGFHGPFHHTPAPFAISLLDDAVNNGLIRLEQEEYDYVLASLVVLQLAYKLYDRPLKFEYIWLASGGLFTKDDFSVFETKLIQSLQWKLYRPTPFCFLLHVIHFVPGYKEELYSIVHLMTCSGKYTGYSASSVAFAAIFFVTGHHVCGMWNSNVYEVVRLLQEEFQQS